MTYSIARMVPMDFDTAVARITATLKQEGFGILSDIDVQATLKAKLGADMPAYRILGACNPAFAHQALQLEKHLGVLLPCNVVVREQTAGLTEVVAIDPAASTTQRWRRWPPKSASACNAPSTRCDSAALDAAYQNRA